MSKWISLISLMLLSFLVSVASAVEITCLSPDDGTFVRGAGAPVIEIVTFPGVAGPALLKIYNGDDDYLYKKLNGAVILINGVVVSVPNVFNQKVEYVEVEVSLVDGDNKLAVQLKSKPGGSINVGVSQEIDAEAAAFIGPAGGVVEVADPDSPIYGTVINIPPTAVAADEPIQITVDFSDPLPGPIPAGAIEASKVIQIEKTTESNFLIPVTVTIPLVFSGLSTYEMPIVFYWSPIDNKYYPVSIVAINKNAGTITFKTTHFSLFLAIMVADIQALTQVISIDSGFRPDMDGFLVPNFTSPFAGGYCFGMSLYAQWYFLNKQDFNDRATWLYWKYRFPTIADDDPIDDLITRELIHRAGLTSIAYWNEAQKELGLSNNLTSLEVALALKTALFVTQEPQLLILGGRDNENKKWTHAVIVYGWNAETERFEIYDSNAPGNNTVTLSSSLFLGVQDYEIPYRLPSAVTSYSFAGIGSYLQGPEFEPFFEGAETAWSSPPFAEFDFLEPIIGEHRIAVVQNKRDVLVQGRVLGGSTPAYYVSIYLKDKKDSLSNWSLAGIAEVSQITSEYQFEISELPSESTSLLIVATNQSPRLWDPFIGFTEFTIVVDQPSVVIDDSNMLQRTLITSKPIYLESGYGHTRVDRFTNVSNNPIRLDSVQFLYLDPDDVGFPNMTKDNISAVSVAAGNIYPEFGWWGSYAYYEVDPPIGEYDCSNPYDPFFFNYDLYSTICGDPDTVNWTNSMMVKDLGSIILEPFEFIDISHTAINDLSPEFIDDSVIIKYSEIVIGFKFYGRVDF